MIKTASISYNQGFGDYKIPRNQPFSTFQTVEKIKKIALIILACIVTAVFIYLSVLFPVATPIPLALSVFTVKWIVDLLGIYNQAPPVTYLFKPTQTAQVAPLARFDKDGNYSAIIPKDSIDSFQWKCKLIECAQSSIVLSGCYAGGKSFDTILDLISKRMKEENSQLRVSILSSSPFHTTENLNRIAQLEQMYPDRFLNIAHPEYTPYYSSTGQSLLINNHTKALVIDGGSHFAIGGSGIVSCWTEHSGLEKPSPTEKPYGILSGFCPEAYRDTDFIFHSPKPTGLGARLHIEMSKLIEVHRYRQTHELSPQQTLPDPTHTSIPEFETATEKTDNLSLACFCSGPEQSNNFQKILIKEINAAKKTLVFAHLFFAPTKPVKKALLKALQRNVKIIIITNKTGPQNPTLHYSYVERSRYGYKQLFEGKENPNITIYEYDVPKVTYHKKIVIIDDETTLIGSSNIIKKSLDQQDYEIDFAVKSSAFARHVLNNLKPDFQEKFKVIDPDIHHITPITHIANTGLSFFSFLN